MEGLFILSRRASLYLRPTNVMDPHYPWVTLACLESQENAERGEYSMQHRMLAAFEQMRSYFVLHESPPR